MSIDKREKEIYDALRKRGIKPTRQILELARLQYLNGLSFEVSLESITKSAMRDQRERQTV